MLTLTRAANGQTQDGFCSPSEGSMEYGRQVRMKSFPGCTQIEVWTKCNEIGKPYGIFGMNQGVEPRTTKRSCKPTRGPSRRHRLASVFVRSEHVTRAYGAVCAWSSFIGFCNGCFWVATQCEVWTKSKRPCKPRAIFGMNYGPTPVDFAMRNQVRMNVFWVVPM